MSYTKCTNERSIDGNHKFITQYSSCICGCGTKHVRCRLCWREKEELMEDN